MTQSFGYCSQHVMPAGASCHSKTHGCLVSAHRPPFRPSLSQKDAFGLFCADASLCTGHRQLCNFGRGRRVGPVIAQRCLDRTPPEVGQHLIQTQFSSGIGRTLACSCAVPMWRDSEVCPPTANALSPAPGAVSWKARPHPQPRQPAGSLLKSYTLYPIANPTVFHVNVWHAHSDPIANVPAHTWCLHEPCLRKDWTSAMKKAS